MFFECQDQLKHRANTGQLLRNDLDLLEQIEHISVELQKVAIDIKKLNSK